MADGEKTSEKYAEAVRLYALGLAVTDVCRRTSTSRKALCAYLSRHHRDLVLRRYGLEGVGDARLPGAVGQSTAARAKYAAAVEAVRSDDLLAFNISGIARLFDLPPASLHRQLRLHFPALADEREEKRRREGLADRAARGVRQSSEEKYAEAVRLLRTTDATLEEAARSSGVGTAALREHVAAWHKDLVALRRRLRREARGSDKAGIRSGNGRRRVPDAAVSRRYAAAVGLFAATTLPMSEIARREGLNAETLRTYLHRWHKDLIARRRGCTADTPLAATKRYKPAAAEKYAPAIERLRATPGLTVAAAAREQGLNPDVFRLYLREHEPALVAARSRKKKSGDDAKE